MAGCSAAGAESGGRADARAAPVAAASMPVARVAVDVPLPHLDRPFDYLVPEPLGAAAVAGCRVRVRFAGRLTGGYLLERAAASDHQGGLAFLERVVSPEPVLSAEVAGLARAVADRYGGTLADVLRLAIPPRHAAGRAGGCRPRRRPGPEQPRPQGSTVAAGQAEAELAETAPVRRPATGLAARRRPLVPVSGWRLVPCRARRWPRAARHLVRAAGP